MRKKVIYLLSVLLLCSCAKHLEESVVESKTSANAEILSFSSIEAFQNAIASRKGNMKTRSSSSMPQNFVSLKQALTNEALSSLNHVEIQRAEEQGLVFEPEDHIIVDPELMEVLNKDREVNINGINYRFVETGLFAYDAKLTFDEGWESLISLQNMSNKSTVQITPDVTFTRIIYAPEEVSYETRGSSFGSRKIVLSDGIVIGKDLIKCAQYAKGEGDASGFQEFASGLFGTNVVLENNFDSKHRMKLRLYDQDYLIYRSVGMTLRMQQKEAGVWWRKKAQEFRYGWTTMECKYSYNSSPFDDKLPHPEVLFKQMVGNNNDLVLFYLPNINTTSGDIDAVYSNSMNQVKYFAAQWYASSDGQKYKGHPQSVYSTIDNDKTIIILYPQDEDRAEGEGKETHRWDITPFSGKVTVSVKSIINGATTFNLKNFSMGECVDVKIGRGRIYGAVKYNNEWRACVIESK